MKPNPYLVSRDGITYDVREMTADALEELEMLLNGDIVAIRDQIAEAQNRRRETGEYTNGDWYRRANTARSIKGQQVEVVRRMRKQQKQEEYRHRAIAFPSYFMDAARTILPAADFDVVMTAAVRMQTADIAGG